MSEAKTRFLNDLARVCNRHGFRIGACGCCGSPWVIKESEKGVYYLEDPEAEDMNTLKWEALRGEGEDESK